ncbi:hypothetical protein H1W00_09370 [Aeromicrobium sp. Marseille-Q0843]|uniref:Uncharacterized protein n=1 Tax=Aeromicrobium phoceense TaxID=2754045 RepID=A0A838XP92_9ACTN|nr:hypothetical protein [Aeromicrobium phoceense]MBA4608680.1 hypothetical protein [Aeromicrobium phoceense]
MADVPPTLRTVIVPFDAIGTHQVDWSGRPRRGRTTASVEPTPIAALDVLVDDFKVRRIAVGGVALVSAGMPARPATVIVAVARPRSETVLMDRAAWVVLHSPATPGSAWTAFLDETQPVTVARTLAGADPLTTRNLPAASIGTIVVTCVVRLGTVVITGVPDPLAEVVSPTVDAFDDPVAVSVTTAARTPDEGTAPRRAETQTDRPALRLPAEPSNEAGVIVLIVPVRPADAGADRVQATARIRTDAAALPARRRTVPERTYSVRTDRARRARLIVIVVPGADSATLVPLRLDAVASTVIQTPVAPVRGTPPRPARATDAVRRAFSEAAMIVFGADATVTVPPGLFARRRAETVGADSVAPTTATTETLRAVEVSGRPRNTSCVSAGIVTAVAASAPVTQARYAVAPSTAGQLALSPRTSDLTVTDEG